MNYKNPILLLVVIILLPAIAQAQNFTYLVGIPGVDPTADFGTYINVLYALSIAIAALLAVIKIIIAGVKWMLSDVVTTKQAAKSDIWGATLGLLIVISAVLVLTTINPQLVNTTIFLSKPYELRKLPDTNSSIPTNYDPTKHELSAMENNDIQRQICEAQIGEWKSDPGADNGWCVATKRSLYSPIGEELACPPINAQSGLYDCSSAEQTCRNKGGEPQPAISKVNGQVLVYKIICE